MTLAFYFYGNDDESTKKNNNYEKVIIAFLVSILFVSVLTDFFVKDVVFHDDEGMYVETFGFLFFVVQILYVLNPTISLFLSWKKYKKLR